MAGRQNLIARTATTLQAHYAAKGIPADQCSTGEQKALLISLILSNVRAVAKAVGHAPILLLDEVAAHLDADRRAALYDEICHMESQTFMTGTDESLFGTLKPRAQTLTVTDEAATAR